MGKYEVKTSDLTIYANLVILAAISVCHCFTITSTSLQFYLSFTSCKSWNYSIYTSTCLDIRLKGNSNLTFTDLNLPWHRIQGSNICLVIETPDVTTIRHCLLCNHLLLHGPKFFCGEGGALSPKSNKNTELLPDQFFNTPYHSIIGLFIVK